jgi:hypothetical protein
VGLGKGFIFIAFNLLDLVLAIPVTENRALGNEHAPNPRRAALQPLGSEPAEAHIPELTGGWRRSA